MSNVQEVAIGGFNLSGFKILVVDDIETNLTIMSKRLPQEGYEVVIARNGSDGVKQAIKHLPDLILLDLKMPVLSGWDALNKLRENEKTKSIPVIAISATITDKDAAKIERHGFNGYCAKPFKIGEFISKIDDWLLPSDDELEEIGVW